MFLRPMPGNSGAACGSRRLWKPTFEQEIRPQQSRTMTLPDVADAFVKKGGEPEWVHRNSRLSGLPLGAVTDPRALPSWPAPVRASGNASSTARPTNEDRQARSSVLRRRLQGSEARPRNRHGNNGRPPCPHPRLRFRASDPGCPCCHLRPVPNPPPVTALSREIHHAWRRHDRASRRPLRQRMIEQKHPTASRNMLSRTN